MNRIILKAQKMTLQQFKDIKKPHNGRSYKKLFFQCELREFVNGDAVFGLVAYGGYKKKGKQCGPKVVLTDNPDGEDKIVEEWPLIFGNLEFAIHPDKKSKLDIHSKIFELLKTKKADYKKMEVNFKPGVSKNPHVDYTITLEGTSEELNPSPPDPPSDY